MRSKYFSLSIIFGLFIFGCLADQNVLGQAAVRPVYSQYKGVEIGMPATDARTKLGTPKDTSDTQDFFVLSDSESAQVYYDTAHKVSVVSVSYLGSPASQLSPKAVFGEDAAAKPDGSIFKMVRYPKAGYWVSYNRTAGSDPLVIVTMQRMADGQ